MSDILEKCIQFLQWKSERRERERERGEKNKYFMWIMFHAVSQNQHFMFNSCEQSKNISESNELFQPC